jgi:hypothetical protein
MPKTELLGNFQVSTWVSSQSQEISLIRKSTRDPIHIIQVDNTSSVPRDARVIGCLPDGTNNLIFNDSGTKTGGWSKEIPNMAVNEIRRRNCPLEYVSLASEPVPVRCEEIWTKRGNGKPVLEIGNLPFGVHIDVK